MGRTVPTLVQLVEQTEQRWAKFRRGLRKEDQAHFDRIFDRLRFNMQAGAYLCHDSPMETILFSIALDHEMRLHAIETILQNAGVLCEIARMDPRPLPQPTRDDTVADRQESSALLFER
jgi:hypothetical protein